MYLIINYLFILAYFNIRAFHLFKDQWPSWLNISFFAVIFKVGFFFHFLFIKNGICWFLFLGINGWNFKILKIGLLVGLDIDFDFVGLEFVHDFHIVFIV